MTSKEQRYPCTPKICHRSSKKRKREKGKSPFSWKKPGDTNEGSWFTSMNKWLGLEVHTPLPIHSSYLINKGLKIDMNLIFPKKNRMLYILHSWESCPLNLKKKLSSKLDGSRNKDSLHREVQVVDTLCRALGQLPQLAVSFAHEPLFDLQIYHIWTDNIVFVM